MLVTGECGKDAIDLVSNHAQSDTKATLLAKHSVDESINNILSTRSPKLVYRFRSIGRARIVRR